MASRCLASIYTDAGISGTTSNRRGLQALLAAASRNAFDIVLIDDTSRLSRDTADALNIFKRLSFAGIRLVAISQGVDSTNEQAHVLMTVHGLVDHLYIKELGPKTHRGLTGVIRRGLSAGGRCYGYARVKTDDDHVRWEINPEEAAVVVRIFEAAAAGYSLKAIAKKLTADRIPPPRPRKGRIASWCWTGIRMMLRNQRYIGRPGWNYAKWERDPGSGKCISRPRPQSDRIVQDLPDQRIVDDALWQAVQRNLAYKREHFGRGGGPGNGNLYGLGRGANHLLSGFLRCGLCGGSLSILTGAGRGRHAKYGCGNHSNRGTCSNGLREREDQVEQRLLARLQTEVLRPDAIEYAVEEFSRQLQARLASLASHLDADRQRATVLEGELGRLWAVIASGGDYQSLREQIAQRETELQAVRDRLLSTGPVSVEADIVEIRRFVSWSLSDLRGLLAQDVAVARAELAKHITTITMTPAGEGKNRFYVASGQWNLMGGTAMRDSGGCGGWI
jgi:DNA invertase Pin-like site-specific DNA recombinase